MKAKIYHNPRCSKSRKSLALLKENGIECDEVRYLETPPDFKTLKELVKMLGVEPKAIVRDKEARAAGIESLEGDDLLKAMVENPVVIQRPLVIYEGKAVIGRPPENVLPLIGKK